MTQEYFLVELELKDFRCSITQIQVIPYGDKYEIVDHNIVYGNGGVPRRYIKKEDFYLLDSLESAKNYLEDIITEHKKQMIKLYNALIREVTDA